MASLKDQIKGQKARAKVRGGYLIQGATIRLQARAVHSSSILLFAQSLFVCQARTFDLLCIRALKNTELICAHTQRRI